MYRSILVALVAGVMLVAFAMPLPMLPDPMGGSALAQKNPTSNATNLNTSRSNTFRDGAPSGIAGTLKQGTTTPPGTGGDPAAATTVKGSKSNGSF